MKWKKDFKAHILERGHSYLESDNVTDYYYLDNTIIATVLGNEIYDVEIVNPFSNNIIYFCTCPYAEIDNCKHMAAVLYHFEKNKSEYFITNDIITEISNVDYDVLKEWAISICTENYSNFENLIDLNEYNKQPMVIYEKEMIFILNKYRSNSNDILTMSKALSNDVEVFCDNQLNSLLRLNKKQAIQLSFKLLDEILKLNIEIDSWYAFEIISNLGEIWNDCISKDGTSLFNELFLGMKRFIKIEKANIFTEWIEGILVANFYKPYMLDSKLKLGLDMINLLSKADDSYRYETWIHYFINISKDFGMHPDTLINILKKHPNSVVAVKYLSTHDNAIE